MKTKKVMFEFEVPEELVTPEFIRSCKSAIELALTLHLSGFDSEIAQNMKVACDLEFRIDDR